LFGKIDAVLLGDGALGMEVGEEGIGDALLGRKGFVGPERVDGYAEDLHVSRPLRGQHFGALLGLDRADWREIERIEEQDDALLPAVVGEGDLLVDCGGEREVGGGVAGLQGHGITPYTRNRAQIRGAGAAGRGFYPDARSRDSGIGPPRRRSSHATTASASRVLSTAPASAQPLRAMARP